MTVGVRNAFIDNNNVNSFAMETDATWSGSRARNSYDADLAVSVAGRRRSYDSYDGGGGNDILNGTAGDDALFFTTVGSARLDAAGSPVATAAHFVSIETFDMGLGDDVLDLTAGTAGAGSYSPFRVGVYGDIAGPLSGQGGRDVLWTGGGGDELYGDAGGMAGSSRGGNDTLHGGAGGDSLYGDAGRLPGSSRGGNDTLHGGAGGDALYGDASTMNDSPQAGNDTLHGGGGNDALYGDSFSMSDSPQAGNDTLHGGDGNDFLIGDAQPNFTSGARAADVFVFAGPGSGLDTIGDFQVAMDEIRIDPGYGYANFAALRPHITDESGRAVIDLDGTAADTDEISLTGVAAIQLVASDFLFA